MDAVTYPHERVREETAHWVTTKADVATSQDLTTRFGVAAVPVAIAVTGEGEILGRILGFVEPDRFADELSRLRAAR
jgi:thioredoxin-related protein